MSSGNAQENLPPLVHDDSGSFSSPTDPSSSTSSDPFFVNPPEIHEQPTNQFPFPQIVTPPPPPPPPKKVRAKSRPRETLVQLHQPLPQRPDSAGTDTARTFANLLGRDRPTPPIKEHRSHSRSTQRITDLLVATNNRLASERLRADTAESQLKECLALIRTLTLERDRAQQDAARVRGDLGLYKVQLDLAQKEIFRAQDILNQVDKKRVEAEENAMKAESIARKLKEEKAIWNAKQEGKLIGYREGLEKGRKLALLAVERRGRGKPMVHEPEYDDYDEYDDRSSQTTLSSLSSPSPTQSRSDIKQQSTPPRPIPPRTRDREQSRSRRSLPDGAPLHVPSVTAPLPVRAPSTQPRSRRRSQSQSSARIPASSPELIHPIRMQNIPPSPTPSHRSIIVPPDNYIPTLDRDSNLITLPPPHELSNPIQPDPSSPTSVSTRALPTRLNGPELRSRDYAYPAGSRARDAPPPQPVATSSPGYYSRTGTPSVASTRISEFDLVGPPRNGKGRAYDGYEEQEQGYQEEMERRRKYTRVAAGTPDSSVGMQRGQRQQPTAMDWRRNANNDTQQYGSSRDVRERSRDAGPDPTTSFVPPPERTSAKSPIDWIKKQFNRSYSASSVPNIAIEPPSQSPSDASDTSHVDVDPIFLTPEHANTFLNNDTTPVHAQPEAQSSIVLQDNQLPFGFVPTSATTPKPESYPVAPIPPGVIYPDPPSRSPTPALKPSAPSKPRKKILSFDDNGAPVYLDAMSIFSDDD